MPVESVERIVIVLAVLVPSVILHEVSHGWVALNFGDDTAKRAGRLTLNPAAHIDPFGSIILPAVLAFTTGAAFGYAKPVPVNRGNLRDPRNHGLLVSLAGPAVNIVLAVSTAYLIRWLLESRILTGGTLLSDLLVSFGIINVILAAFNLLPIPPLDGSAVIERFLPNAWLPAWNKIRQYSMIGLLLLVFVFDGLLGNVFAWARDLWVGLIV